MSNQQLVQAVTNSLSLSRVETYEKSVVATGDVGPAALALYEWNAQISGAFMAPLHICEVGIRNAVSDALAALCGDRWPWSSAFERSLPAPPGGYNSRSDLRAARRQPTTGKVIPELKFVFWHHEPIFTRALADDLDKITTLIRFRCRLTADWMMRGQRVMEYM